MENLDNDMLENILSRLPTEVALYAKRVRTTWRAALRHKTEKTGFLFSHRRRSGVEFFYEDEYDHYDHAKMNYHHSCTTLTKLEHDIFTMKTSERNTMVGSCNGLVCFGKFNENVPGADPAYLVCNPLTGESFSLPEYSYPEVPWDISSTNLIYGRLTSGFGYCPSTNEYKVVTIYCFSGKKKGHVQVCTVGGEWRYIGYIGRYDTYSLYRSSGIYANGTLYWLHENLNSQGFQYRTYSKYDLKHEIVSFDLEREEFYYITLLSATSLHEHNCRSPLWLLGGNNKLYLVDRSSPTDIWVCKREKKNAGTTSYTTMEECGSSSCPTKELSIKLDEQPIWTKEFSIRSDLPYDWFAPFAITRSNDVLLWYHRAIGKRLYCYDPKTSTLNKLWDGSEDIYQVIPHKQSIVSLKDLGETNATSFKDLEKQLLQVTSKVFDRNDGTTTATTETTNITYEEEKKQAGSRDAKKLKNC